MKLPDWTNIAASLRLFGDDVLRLPDREQLEHHASQFRSLPRHMYEFLRFKAHVNRFMLYVICNFSPLNRGVDYSTWF